MRIVRVKAKKKTKTNPKKGKAKTMAKKKRHHKKVSVKANPKRKKHYKKTRHNPVKIGKRRRTRSNPKLNVKGILEQIKPIAFGAFGALVISKAISFIPLKPEQENLKPWIKMGVGIGIAYFGRKYPIAKFGGIFIATMAGYNMLGEKFPALVAGTDDFEVYGEDDYESQLLGNQVSFAGGAGLEGQSTLLGDQVVMGMDDINYQMNGW